ncbi:hypothetical protein ARMSODRAFT_966761 [Armillaria solidipes]|uniref:Uncharacterized protein n=1 Tax=Armillaria solidipes TaxID=1076256 RepID=A0A2H3APR3_9AGAR|nr:hypothetical protein ARMSODRAFT_966761 [Armillaria solidipes]
MSLPNGFFLTRFKNSCVARDIVYNSKLAGQSPSNSATPSPESACGGFPRILDQKFRLQNDEPLQGVTPSSFCSYRQNVDSNIQRRSLLLNASFISAQFGSYKKQEAGTQFWLQLHKQSCLANLGFIPNLTEGGISKLISNKSLLICNDFTPHSIALKKFPRVNDKHRPHIVTID